MWPSPLAPFPGSVSGGNCESAPAAGICTSPRATACACAHRIAAQFPVIGAANISVRDLLFRTEESRHQYLFTVDYTVGVIRGKVGRSTVAGFTEPVSRGGRIHSIPPALSLAPPNLTGPPAYEFVLQKLAHPEP